MSFWSSWRATPNTSRNGRCDIAGEYASQTTVPVERSFAEIKRTLQRFGATAFGYVEQGDLIGIQFEIIGLRVAMKMRLPDRDQCRLTSSGRERPETAIDKDHEAACRQRWRTLANAIKAKLAMVDDGLSSVETEFLANIMLPGGETVGERIAPDIHEVVRTGQLPPLIPGLPRPARVTAIGERVG